MAYNLSAIYPPGSPTPIDCDFSTNTCRFSSSCSELGQSDLPMSILLLDDTGASFNLTTLQSGMLTDGENFGAPGYCYIPLFMHGLSNKENDWYVGSIFMGRYVVLYDNTPYQRNQSVSYAQIGFGLVSQKKIDNGIRKQYDISASFYHPYPNEDSSHPIGAYDPKPPKPVPPAPTPPGPGPTPSPPKPDSGDSWLADNVVLVATGGILLAACLVALFYCLCCSQKRRIIFDEEAPLSGTI